jgi:hypothetical protein
MIDDRGGQRPVETAAPAYGKIGNTSEQALLGAGISRNIKELFDLGNDWLPTARTGNLGFLRGHGTSGSG